MNEEHLFNHVLELPLGERTTFLEKACGDDTDLLRRVEVLLHAHENPGGFLAEPALSPARQRDTPHGPTPFKDAGGISNGAETSITERPGTTIGPYQLQQLIGEGGMGAVFLAEQTHPVQRQVALKIIKPGMDSRQVVARFEAERQALAMMDHPNIAKVFDAGTIEAHGSQPVGLGRPYFVMELVKGVPITKYCDDHCHPVRQRLEVFICVCQAIQHAHQKGLIHRDLKPSNVIVTEYDHQPTPKVIDFGIAKAVDRQTTLHTNAGMLVGTPEYMSPEQADSTSSDIDTRSDIYSLGVMLYELLTGETPFARRSEKANIWEVLRFIREEEPAAPSACLGTVETLTDVATRRATEPGRLVKQVRGELDWIVLKALEKDRSRRYDTAAALAEDLRRYLNNEPVHAGPPNRIYRLKKFVRRNRAKVFAASLVLLSLIGGIVGTTIYAVRANRERDDKQTALDDLEKEQRNTQAALTKEKQARKQAMTALRNMTNELVERQMTRQVTLTNEDRAFLKSIIAEYEAFAAMQGEEEESRAIRAEGHMRVGLLRGKLGEWAEAKTCANRACHLYRELAAEFPTTKHYRRQLAACHENLGLALRNLHQLADAESAVRQAIDLFQGLEVDSSADVHHKRDLAMSIAKLGSILLEDGKNSEAIEQFHRSRAILNQLTVDRPNDPTTRLLVAQNHHNLAMALRAELKHSEADAEESAAIHLFKKLVTDFPSIPEYRLSLGNSQVNLGTRLFDTGKPQDGEIALRSALTIWRQLAADFPTVPDYRRQLASGHSNLAMKLASLKNNADAESEYGIAAAIWKQLAADFPAEPSYRRSLAICYNNLANVQVSMNKLVEAEANHQEARAIRKQLVAEYPSAPEYAVDLGGSYCNQGNYFIRNGKTAEALNCYSQAIAALEPVARPDVLLSREFLRNSYLGRTNALMRLTRYAKAVPDWDHYLELVEPVNRAETRLLRAACLARVEPHAAVVEAEDVCRNPNASARLHYLGAAVNAMASEKAPETAMREAYAVRAVALLGQARDGGYFKDPKHIERFKIHSEFNSLADREDFRAWLLSLEGKTEK